MSRDYIHSLIAQQIYISALSKVVQNNSRYREGGFSEVNSVVPALQGLAVFLRNKVRETLVPKRSGIV